MRKYTGEDFINKIYQDLHNSNVVMHTAQKSDNKNEKIEKYFDRLDRITKKVYDENRTSSVNDINVLKKFYYDKYVIKKENIPDSYFKRNEEIALERGYGHLTYTDILKEEECSRIIKEQEESLGRWIDYLASDDTNMYPTWFKYYVFQGMLNLGIYDKEKNEYTRRTKSTVHPFIDVNREALSVVYDELLKFLNKEEMTDDKLKQLITNGNFGKIYSYSIRKLDMVKKDETKSEDGIWKKYNQGSDPEILFNDINGKGTGWCTAGGLVTASSHLNGGDFYVYYTKDKDGCFSIPRIAIRKENYKIAEIRGIGKSQNLEPNMEKLVEKKLEESEFPDRDEYKKKVYDMEMMTYIYTKHKNNVELTKSDLKFLYEIDEKIIGFGYERDPRICEIQLERDLTKDLTLIFNCKEEDIGFYKEDIFKREILYFYGNLNLGDLISIDGVTLPKELYGSLDLSGLTSIEGLILPEKIMGGLYLNRIKSAESLKFPDRISGDLWLSNLIDTKGMIFPKEVDGDLGLNGLENVDGLKLPEKVGGNLELKSLKSTKDLILPEKIGRNLLLDGLTSAEGLVLPKKIGGTLSLGLTIAKNIKFPEMVGGDLWLDSLESAEGLILPENIGRDLILSGLTSATGITFPKEVRGKVELANLINAQGVILPEKIGGSLFLDGLINGNGLKFPEKIGGSLFLTNLTDAKGLVLPREIESVLHLNRLIKAEDMVMPEKVFSLNLDSLPRVKKLVLPREIRGNLNLFNLESAEGIIFPKKIGYTLDLRALINVDGLKLPEEIGENLCLDSLTNCEGLKLPEKIGGSLFLNSLKNFNDLKFPEEVGSEIVLGELAQNLNRP